MPFLLAGIQTDSFAAAGHNQRLDAFAHRLRLQFAVMLEKLPFVVIDHQIIGLIQEPAQFITTEHRQALAGVKEERDAFGFKLGGMIQHRLASVRRDDAQTRSRRVRHLVALGEIHRAGVEGGDLVVFHIGGDEGLRGIGAWHFGDELVADALDKQLLAIGREILPDRGHRQAGGAEQVQVIGDVAGAAAEFTAQFRHHEADI